MINPRFSLENAFQEILYRINNWINEGSGWIVELIESQCISISTYRPLWGISYVKLPAELKSPKKGLINIKNNDQRCFPWCYFRYINPVKINPERVTREEKKLVNSLNYDVVGFLVRGKDFSKTEKKSNICINVFCYENELTFAIHVSEQKFENSMDLLFAIDEISHIVCISKIFTDLCFIKQKIKTINTFVRVAYSALVVKMYWQNIKFVWALMVHNL